MFFTSIKEISRLRKEINRLLSKVINGLRKETNRLLIKGINRVRKEINRLLSKGISNIHLKVTKKNWYSRNFDFLNLKNLSPGQFFESSNSHKYHWIPKLLVAT